MPQMTAMVLDSPGEPLHRREIDRPDPGPGQLLVKVAACGVCRTDLHVVDGDLTEPNLPIVPGHEIVGHVASAPIAGRRGKTSATHPVLPATPSMAAMRNMRWPMRTIAFRSTTTIPTPKRRRCSAPG